MKKYLNVTIVVGLAAMMASCSPAQKIEGYRLDQDQLALIEPGQSDKDDVLELMGSPSNMATFQKGGDVWYYISRKTERIAFLDSETISQDVLVIRFDETDMVSGLKKFAKEDGRDIAFVERKTETKGKELGLFEQLFGNLGRFNNKDQDYFAN